MFLVNSRYRLFSATPFGSGSQFLHLMRAHLLPKLRCHFAEFLKQGSLTRLRILSSPTCVGLRYGHLINSLEAFLGSLGSTSLRDCSLHITSRCSQGSGFAWNLHLRAYTGTSITRMAYPSTSPHHSNADPVVQEY